MPDQANQLRQLVRTAFAQRPASTAPPLVTVSGAARGCGATTVACETARALSQLGQRVLLVDGDLVRPRLADRLGIEPGGAVSDLLAGRKRLIETMTSLDRGLYAATGGDRSTAPLDESAVERLVAEFASIGPDFDMVVIDAGAAGTPWSDRLWRLAQAVLLVATERCEDVRAAYAAVKLAHAPHNRLGPTDSRLRLVLNRCPKAEPAERTARQFAETCASYLKLEIAGSATLSRCDQFDDDRRHAAARHAYHGELRDLAGQLISELRVHNARLGIGRRCATDRFFERAFATTQR